MGDYQSCLFLCSSAVYKVRTIRHRCQFPENPLFTKEVQFGTDVNFRKIPCTHGWYSSAEIVNSGKSPVLMVGIVRRRCQFPEMYLYPRPIQFGTDADFWIFPRPQANFIRYKKQLLGGYRTDGVICSAQIMVCGIPTVQRSMSEKSVAETGKSGTETAKSPKTAASVSAFGD